MFEKNLTCKSCEFYLKKKTKHKADHLTPAIKTCQYLHIRYSETKFLSVVSKR